MDIFRKAGAYAADNYLPCATNTFWKGKHFQAPIVHIEWLQGSQLARVIKYFKHIDDIGLEHYF